MGVIDLISLQIMLENSGEFNINNDIEAESIILDTVVKKDETMPLTTPEPIPTPKPESEKRLITSYYDPDKEWYGIQSISEFSFTDLRIPFLITENPLGIIKSAKEISDFTGDNPINYTYEDLVVELDKKMEVAKKQTNWTFESSTFIASDVLDENFNSLSPTIGLPNPDDLVTTFSFDNQNELKKFIIRTTPRNDNSDAKYGSDKNNYPTDNTLTVTGEDLLKPMVLKTGDKTNIKISRDYAKELLEDKKLESTSTGSIKGSMGLDKSRLTANALKLFNVFLKNDFVPIPLVKSKNTMNFDFAIPYARFDKNTESLGDSEEQNLGYSKFVVNKAMDSDGFDKDTKPNKDIKQAGEAFISDEDYKIYKTKLTLNGKDYTFKGWNTKADGKGKFIKKDTVIKYEDLNQRTNDNVEEDITLFAIWEYKKLEPQPCPQPEPKPVEKVILKLDENHADGRVSSHELNKCEIVEKYLYTPIREGYIFKGWNTVADDSGVFVKASDEVCEDLRLYAIWDMKEEPVAPYIPLWPILFGEESLKKRL